MRQAVADRPRAKRQPKGQRKVQVNSTMIDISNLNNLLARESGGESGIRTRVTVSRKHTFQACAFNHSATSPSFRRGRFRRAGWGDTVSLGKFRSGTPHRRRRQPADTFSPHLSRQSNRRGAHLVDPVPNAKRSIRFVGQGCSVHATSAAWQADRRDRRRHLGRPTPQRRKPAAQVQLRVSRLRIKRADPIYQADTDF